MVQKRFITHSFHDIRLVGRADGRGIDRRIESTPTDRGVLEGRAAGKGDGGAFGPAVRPLPKQHVPHIGGGFIGRGVGGKSPEPGQGRNGVLAQHAGPRVFATLDVSSATLVSRMPLCWETGLVGLEGCSIVGRPVPSLNTRHELEIPSQWPFRLCIAAMPAIVAAPGTRASHEAEVLDRHVSLGHRPRPAGSRHHHSQKTGLAWPRQISARGSP